MHVRYNNKIFTFTYFNFLNLFRFIYEDSNWFIMDSDGYKSSSNGTWILADEYTEIYSGMQIRAGSNIFECYLTDTSNNMDEGYYNFK